MVSVELLLAVIVAMLAIITAMLGFFGQRITARLDNHGRRIGRIESHHYRLTGEDLTI